VNVSLGLPGYYCKNKGHQPTYLPFTNVNDGVCDYELCCDGSDEWAGVGKVKCPDKCKEIGAQWRKQDEVRQRAMGAANKKRKDLVIESARLRREVADRIKSLTEEIHGTELRVKGLENDLAEIERRERTKVTTSAPGGGKLGVVTGLAKSRINLLKENLVATREERDETIKRVKQLEGVLATFKDEYNPNFNDEGVKRAVRAWEDYAAAGRMPELDDKVESDMDFMVKSDEENGINWAEYEGQDEEGDIDVRKCCSASNFLSLNSSFAQF
jgi:protein kinase C substrate 80K-H